MNSAPVFNNITFPFIFGDDSFDTEETQTFNLAANEVKILTFTYPNVAPAGSYSLDYILSNTSCLGNITFDIGNDCVSFISGVWS
jgi:hypothetical protein